MKIREVEIVHLNDISIFSHLPNGKGAKFLKIDNFNSEFSTKHIEVMMSFSLLFRTSSLSKHFIFALSLNSNDLSSFQFTFFREVQWRFLLNCLPTAVRLGVLY